MASSTSRRSVLLGAVVAVALGSLGLAGTADAQRLARTTVTITAQGVELSGYVSSRSRRCAVNRTVTVYRQRGRRQNPRGDARIASDTAQANGPRYQWNTGNTGLEGRFYAYVRRIRGCGADASRTVTARRQP